jgi:hypothetical protein
MHFNFFIRFGFDDLIVVSHINCCILQVQKTSNMECSYEQQRRVERVFYYIIKTRCNSPKRYGHCIFISVSLICVNLPQIVWLQCNFNMLMLIVKLLLLFVKFDPWYYAIFAEVRFYEKRG